MRITSLKLRRVNLLGIFVLFLKFSTPDCALYWTPFGSCPLGRPVAQQLQPSAFMTLTRSRCFCRKKRTDKNTVSMMYYRWPITALRLYKQFWR